MRVRFLLEYDGTDFFGWQRQATERTVQGVFESALAAVVGGSVRSAGAGRTDTGVHAEGQVAHADFATHLEIAELVRALNATLPRDLSVRAAAPAEPDFDARKSARGKHYRYRLWNGAQRSALRERDHHHVPQSLDITAIANGCRALLGTHDWTSFQAAGSEVATTRRTLERLELAGEPGGVLAFEVEGDGFLRHMVRNLVGTLLEVGLGRRVPEALPELLRARDRSRAGPTAPARGLTLVGVCYAAEIRWEKPPGFPAEDPS